MKQQLLLVFCLALGKVSLWAQPNFTILASELRSPIGIDRDDEGNFWIAEQGTGDNDGAVTVIWQDGSVQRVIDSLINVFIPAEQLIEGPVRVQVIDDYVYVFSPMGDSPSELGTLVFERKAISKGGTPLGRKDIITTIRVNDAAVKAGRAESHPYSVVSDGCDLYFADAAANAIYHKDGKSGVIKEFVGFPPIPNPLPFGPPMIDPVPTRIIHNPDGGFYVSQLTGFPFLPGAANIFKVSANGQLGTAFNNLSVITDMTLSPDGDGIFVLELTEFDSTFNFTLNTSKIIQLFNDGTRDTLATGFGPSAGFTLDDDGNYIITHLFFGLVIKIDKKTTKVKDVGLDFGNKLNIYPNPVTEKCNINIESKGSNDATIWVYNMLGQLVHSEHVHNLEYGINQIEINTSSWNANSHQSYIVKVVSGNNMQYGVMVKK